MNQILFRTDASSLIGSGHVMRCRSLARVLKTAGAEVVFVCRKQVGDLIDLLATEFLVLTLPDNSLVDAANATKIEPLTRFEYQSWLGCSQSVDAEQTLHLLQSADIQKVDWVVVDHYSIDHHWELTIYEKLKTFQSRSPQFLVIDDLADRAHYADILLDQNFYGDRTLLRYNHLIPSNCKLLLGYQYALISQEYCYLSSLIPARTSLRRILVYFGAYEPVELAATVVSALTIEPFLNIDIDIVLGPHQHVSADNLSIFKNRGGVTIHNHLPSLAGLICRADIAIGAGGSTIWERSALGLPSIIFSLADNQVDVATSFCNHGFGWYGGNTSDITINNIQSLVASALKSHNLFKLSSKLLSEHFGSGASALSKLMFS